MMVLKLTICNYLILTNHHQRDHTGLFRYVNLLIIHFHVCLITLESGINVGPGKLGKKNKRRALNTHVLCSE